MRSPSLVEPLVYGRPRNLVESAFRGIQRSATIRRVAAFADMPWSLVIAHDNNIGVRVLLRDAAQAADFGRWLRASGWHVRFEPTHASNPPELNRTCEEEDLAAALVAAHTRWVCATRT